MAQPTKTPIGSDPAASSIYEIWRNIITDLGGTVSDSSLDGLLQSFNLALYNWQVLGPEYIGMVTPTCLGSTIPRQQVNVATTTISTGVLTLGAVWLDINTTVSNLNFLPGTTGDAGPTNQWMALFNASGHGGPLR